MKSKFLAMLLTLSMVFNMVLPYGAMAADVQDFDTPAQVVADENVPEIELNDVDGDTTTADVPTTDDEQQAAADEPTMDEPAATEPAADGNTAAEFDEKEVEQPAAAVPMAATLGADEPMLLADTPATSGSCGATDADNVTWSYDAATKTLTISGTGAMKGYYSFYLEGCPWDSYRSQITKVVVQSGVTKIAGAAFYNFKALTDVSIADTVTELSSDVFGSCKALTTISLPDSITTMGFNIFEDCKNLTTVKLPAGLTKLNSGTFAGCKALTSITLPETITEIGERAFQQAGLTSITIPDKVTTIGNYAFNLGQLVSIKLPDSVTSIGNYAFQFNEKLTDVTLPANLTALPNCAFKGCTALEKITIPDNVTTIGEDAFNGCTALKLFNFPAKLTTLGESAFEGCTGLTGTITIPQTVTTMDGYVFKGCTGITEVSVPASVAEWGRWAYGAIFQNCTGITKATIGAIAPKNMFDGCTALKEVKILDGVTSFGNTTFNGCTALTTVEVPAGLTDWGVGAFNGVDTGKITFTGAGKDNFVWTGDVLYNKEKTTMLAVRNATGEFTVPDSVTAIGANCFSGCTGLTAVKFGENSKLATIGDSAFDGCSGLTSFSFPKGDLTLGKFVFQGTSIESMVIPANVKEFAEMGECLSLKNVKIYAPLDALPARAFSNCTNLESIYIPPNILMTGASTLPTKSGNLKYIYYGGTRSDFEGYNFWKQHKNQIINKGTSVICDYVEPTTETGKLAVVAQPADIACDNIAAANQELSIQLKYPDGVEKNAGDKIWASMYYTKLETPNGLQAVLPVAATSQSWDAETMTATCNFAEQSSTGQDCTWYYILVAYKTDTEGNTTMLVSDPVKVSLTNKEVEIVGTGKADAPYVVSTADQMIVLANKLNSGSILYASYIELAADIELPKGWAQLGAGSKSYQGVFDGKGHTITFAKGAKGLVGTLAGSSAVIKNLNIKGEYIAGSAIADNCTSGTIQDCTLLSGTCTLNSGFVQESGKLSALNCNAEENVKIGWNAAKDVPSTAKGIGTVVGFGSFEVVSCNSAADLYGTNNVGGIAGFKGYSMRGASIKNCGFTGSVSASGEFAGGIMARGYDAESAPNTPAANIDNCYVIADISGVQGVGGIFGGEAGLDQCWDNGIGTVRNCVFYGSVKTVNGTFPEHSGSDGYKCSSPANTVGGSKGGIIGFMRSLNKNTRVENNYYFVTNKDKVSTIGAIEHIDTTAVKATPIKTDFTGEGTDTPQEYYKNFTDVFYYSTAEANDRDDLSYLKWFVDREDYGTDNWTEYMSVIKPQLNRTDNPLGQDADKLGKAVTAEEMADPTVVLKALNEDANSMHNWVLADGAVCPTISAEPVAYQLAISGDYKTEYYIGDELDMTGAEFTATWTDGSTTNPTIDDVKITGFDSTARKVLTLTASFGSASTTFDVKVLKKPAGGGSETPSTIKVKFTLLGDTQHDEYGKEENLTIHTLKAGNLVSWLPEEEYTIGLNDTVWDLLKKVQTKHSNVKFSNPGGNYVNMVTFNGLRMEEKDNTANSGWMYTLNDHHPLLGVSEQFLDDGDIIVFHWTDDYTVEEGSEDFDNSGSHLGGGGGGAAVDTRFTAADVKDLIDKIGTVTKDSKSAIEAAREAYDSLTAAQKKNVTNYDKLTAAEKAYTELTGEKIDTAKLPFTDVAKGAWYYDAIKAMYDKGLMNGESATKFMPNNKLSRAMLVTILYRMQNEPNISTTALFNDVANGQWYTKAVAWASANNVVNGVGEGKFAPNDSVTRQELAAMLYRYAKAVGMDTTQGGMAAREFADWEQTADWARSEMQWAVTAGLIKGNDDNTINPNGTATRAEVATVIIRLLSK